MKNILVGIVIILIGLLVFWLGVTTGEGLGGTYYLGFILMLGGGFYITWSFFSRARENEKEKLKEILKEEKEED